MSTFIPFFDETQAKTIGGLSIENRLNRVAVFGSLDITRDQRGQRDVHALLDLLGAVAASLDAAGDLPEDVDAVEPSEAPTGPRDPFAGEPDPSA